MSLQAISARLSAHGIQHTVVVANTVDAMMDIITDNLETWVGKSTNATTVKSFLRSSIKNNNSGVSVFNVNAVETARGNILVTFAMQSHKFTKNYKCLLGIDHGKVAEVSAITENSK